MLGTSLTHINTDDRGKVLSLDLSILSEAQTLAITDLVICTGPWTSSVLHHTLDTDSPLRHLPFFDAAAGVKGTREHSIVVRGLDIGTHALFTTTTYRRSRNCIRRGSPDFYCRPDDTTYICGDTDGEDLPAMVDQVEPSDWQISRLIEQAGSIAPALLDEGTKILTRQACFLPMSKNSGRPIVRFDSATGFGVAAGHSCWGITLSLGTGQVMAELILEGQARSADISLLGGLHEGSSEEEAAPKTADLAVGAPPRKRSRRSTQRLSA
ncbi:hypothetical protein OC846_006839 [Tilletia horrida]|uniref:FAD dependent oxidoreductase domain-containing protein n=1 Tax=Tilletia horrida TaxID=155126 RepID=A0AAN6JUP2_9BASI|nr:hypothetical protein OC846_006839 [Tilletia horrida]